MADAKQKRNEQLQRWLGSETDLEPPVLKKKKTKVKFDDGAVFLAACSSGDTEEVLRLIDRGADINYANVDGLTALHQVGVSPSLHVTAVIFRAWPLLLLLLLLLMAQPRIVQKKETKQAYFLVANKCVSWNTCQMEPIHSCCLPTWPRQPVTFNPPSQRRADELCCRLPVVVLKGHSEQRRQIRVPRCFKNCPFLLGNLALPSGLLFVPVN